MSCLPAGSVRRTMLSMASDSSPSAGPGSRSRTSRPGWWPGISTLRLPAEATRNAVLCALRKSRSPAREMLQIDVPEGSLDVKRARPGFLSFSSWSFAFHVEPGGRACPGPQAKPGAEGGAVKAGPLGPPEGAALTVPGWGCRQPALAPEPRQGLLGRLWGLTGTAVTSPCSITERAGRGPGCLTFLRPVIGAW